MPTDIGILLEIAKLLVVPVTVVAVLLLLKPLVRTLADRMTKIELKGFEISPAISTQEPGESLPAPSFVTESRRRIAEGLKEDSREKLENLRVALETEQVNQLIQYHANSLAQSRISFWFSIGAGCVGFLVIIIGALQLVFGAQLATAVLSVVAGTVIDAVAALFFTQSNQARKLMTEFFDKLRTDRQFNEALRLCESIPDSTVQSNIKARLCLFFAGIPANLAVGDHTGLIRTDATDGTEPANPTLNPDAQKPRAG
ncbi:MAG: hypothetical protein Q7U64_12800 [Desulfocapsaceae bacterium]|nr:hypothetical protein [Desulfocapsaceae bacterium]